MGCVQVCARACAFICMCLCMSVCVYVYVCEGVCTCMRVHVYACAHVGKCVSVSECVCACVRQHPETGQLWCAVTVSALFTLFDITYFINYGQIKKYFEKTTSLRSYYISQQSKCEISCGLIALPRRYTHVHGQTDRQTDRQTDGQKFRKLDS